MKGNNSTRTRTKFYKDARLACTPSIPRGGIGSSNSQAGYFLVGSTILQHTDLRRYAKEVRRSAVESGVFIDVFGSFD